MSKLLYFFVKKIFRVLWLMFFAVAVFWVVAKPEQRMYVLVYADQTIMKYTQHDVVFPMMEQFGFERPAADQQQAILKKPAVSLQQLDNALVALKDRVNAVHDRQDFSAFCKPTTRAIDDVEVVSSVYKWTDADGSVHYGEAPPSVVVQQSENLTDQFAANRQYLRLNLQAINADLDVDVENKIENDVKQIYEVLAHHVDDQYLRQIELNIKVFGQQQEFDVYRDHHAPSLEYAAGFYMAVNNEVAAMQQPYPALTRSLIRHESTHVINAGLYGPTPNWFNEGLSEYFEGLQASGQSKTIQVDQYWYDFIYQQIQRNEVLPLNDIFTGSDRAWMSLDVDSRYASAWSLIFYLMSSEHGRSLLQAYMREIAEHPCFAVDTVAFMNRHIDGGMNRLEQDWLVWQQGALPSAHYY